MRVRDAARRLVAGGYVASYGWWETRVLAGAAANDPVIATAGSVQRSGGRSSADR